MTSGPNGVATRTSGPIGQTASSTGGMHINPWKNSEKYQKSIDIYANRGLHAVIQDIAMSAACAPQSLHNVLPRLVGPYTENNMDILLCVSVG